VPDNLDNDSSAARGRARVAPLIPQPHGGALLPFTPARGAAAARSSVRAAKKHALALLAEATPQATRKLILLLDSDDDRVAAVAASHILDRSLGKPGDLPQLADDAGDKTGLIKVDFLDSGEQAELFAAIEIMRRLEAVARARFEASREVT
jgi:hypothetical protein